MEAGIVIVGIILLVLFVLAMSGGGKCGGGNGFLTGFIIGDILSDIGDSFDD